MIQYYDWLHQIESVDGVMSISKELLLFSFSDIKSYVKAVNPFHSESISKPNKFNFFVFIHHKAGSVKFEIDLKQYELAEPGNMIKVLPGQIVSFVSTADDFDGDVIVMSTRFVEDMLIYESPGFPISFDKHSSPIIECSELDSIVGEDLYKSLRQVLNVGFVSPHKTKIVQHIMMAVFYASEHHSNVRAEKPRTNAEALSREFLSLVKENFRTERQLSFYANKMCITPRYLSRVVKETTQSSAADWIERLVVLEARALLKSTNMTVQQISDELNFPSQTFFGKYFKRRVGLSPKEYRRDG